MCDRDYPCKCQTIINIYHVVIAIDPYTVHCHYTGT